MNNKGPAANEEDDLQIDLQTVFLICFEIGFIVFLSFPKAMRNNAIGMNGELF